MKSILLIISILSLSFSVMAADEKHFDYSQLKPEHFKNLEDKHEFTDKSGETFRVINTERRKGVQVKLDGRWKYHGVFYTLYKNGQINTLTNYIAGIKHGTYQSFNSKGQLKFDYYHDNGKKEGPWVQYTDSGNVFEKRTYVNGLIEGKVYTYSGKKLQFEKDYKNGKRHGQVLQYSTSSGKLVARSQYENGKRIGKTEWLH